MATCLERDGRALNMDEVVAIDGPAASGKSTVARLVAAELGVPYINTGNLYRAITWLAMASGDDWAAPEFDFAPLLAGLTIEHRREPDGSLVMLIDGRLAGSELRTPEVAAQVSAVAARPEVRQWLIGRQRDCTALGLVVMEGRDIGTVIFPRARYKFFLTASPEVRARRRLAQDGETVAGATVASVAAEIARRDALDSSRTHAPLRRAADAELVDSSALTVTQVVDLVARRVRARQQEAPR